ncbi:MAG: hypothetical protein J6A61_03975 [Clostridia bacterium]|nr:hypothetical protein [Clostridia bacterium]
MEQKYFDEIHKRKADGLTIVYKALLILGCVVVCPILFIVGGQLGLPLAAGVIYGAYLLWRKLNREYEYIFTNGELDIDVIYGMQSRRRMITVSPRQVVTMGPASSLYETMQKDASIQKKLDFSDGNLENAYVLVVDSNQLKKLVLFSPTDHLVESMKFYLRERFIER